MQIGIIAEGKSDLSVIINILRGIFDINDGSITYLRPELHVDETDLSEEGKTGEMREDEFSNWTLVKKECQSKEKIIDFLDVPILDERFVVIQIDTAECEDKGYDVVRPQKKNSNRYREDYSKELVEAVAIKMNEWLGNNEEINENQLVFAIAVEETEAWLLTQYESGRQDTAKYNDPKKRLDTVLNQKFSKKKINEILKKSVLEKHNLLSKPFSQKKKLDKYRKLNHSLDAFCVSLENLDLSE